MKFKICLYICLLQSNNEYEEIAKDILQKCLFWPRITLHALCFHFLGFSHSLNQL